MKIADIIKEVRRRTGDTQQSLADALNVSFSTVNRWETGRNVPMPLAMNSLYAYCEQKGIDFKEFEGNTLRDGSGVVTLYHGSKSGISGGIRPISRDLCDFGKGFYMGTDRLQPLTLICNFPNARLYTLNVDLSDLRILEIEVGIDWALMIAYHRGKMELAKSSSIYQKYAAMANDCDMIIGYIADDRMFVVLDRFFAGEITDIALIESLSVLKLGKQYVAVSDKACSKISIVEEKKLSKSERDELRKKAEALRAEGIDKAEEICKKHRREGRFFDEILSGGMKK